MQLIASSVSANLLCPPPARRPRSAPFSSLADYNTMTGFVGPHYNGLIKIYWISLGGLSFWYYEDTDGNRVDPIEQGEGCYFPLQATGFKKRRPVPTGSPSSSTTTLTRPRSSRRPTPPPSLSCQRCARPSRPSVTPLPGQHRCRGLAATAATAPRCAHPRCSNDRGRPRRASIV